MAKRQVAREANAKKMHDAQTGGSGTGLGPSQMDQAQIKQRGAIASQAATAGSEEAQIAQAQQTSQSLHSSRRSRGDYDSVSGSMPSAPLDGAGG